MSEFKEFVPRSNSGVAPQLSAVYVPACPAPAGHTIQHLQLPRPSNVACVGVMAVEVVFAPNLCVSLWPQYVRTRSTCPPPQHLRSVSCRAIVVDVHDIPLGALKAAKKSTKNSSAATDGFKTRILAKCLPPLSAFLPQDTPCHTHTFPLAYTLIFKRHVQPGHSTPAL